MTDSLHSAAAEQAVLGALLLDSAALPRVVGLLDDAAFYRPEHRLVFGAIRGLVDEGKRADAIAVFERLESQGQAGAAPMAVLHALSEAVPSSGAVESHARIVADKARRRRALDELDTARALLQSGGDVGQVLKAAVEAVGPMSRTDAERVVLLNGADLKPETVRWLWRGWLAKGKLHILAGAPGQGKTTLAQSFAATVTRGGQWPDGSQCVRGSVLVWSGEDDAADTLLPRLLAMGAEPSRVHFIQGTRDGSGVRPFDPARDLAALAAAAERIGDVLLVVVDPVVSAVGGADSHKNTEVRRALQPLVDLAAKLGAAVLGISHFGKASAGKDPTERVVGSVAFSAVARIVMVAAKVRDDDGSERRVLARSKSNIGPDDGGFTYEIAQGDLPGHAGIEASRVVWGEAVEGNARDLLAQREADPDADGPGDAVVWLRELLAYGAVGSREVKRQADEAGFAWRTVQRAMRRAGAQSRRVGFGKGAEWFLAANRATGATFAPFAPVSEAGADGANGGANGTANDPHGQARAAVAEAAQAGCWAPEVAEAWLADAERDPAGVLGVLRAGAAP